MTEDTQHPNQDLGRLVELSKYSDDDINKMIGHLSKGYFNGAVNTPAAQFRATLELILTIRRFDNTSTELITTTNKLTKTILGLTIGAFFFGGVQAIVALIILFSSK